MHLIAPTRQIEGILAKTHLSNFKDMLVDCLTSVPGAQADIETLKQLLFYRHREALFDTSHQRYDEYAATNEGG